MGEAMIRGRRTRINYAKDWQYTTNDTATLVTKYIGSKTDVIVPSKINGKPVVLQNSGEDYSTTLLFGERASSIKNIRIKEGVVFNNNDASFAFADCDALISVSGLPKTTVNMSNAFYQCTNLVNAPNLPENATDMSCIFQDCVSLINAPTIPSNVTNMSYAFCRCDNLIDAPLIPNEVVDMSGTFSECSNLVNAPIIPTNVTNIYGLFSDCFKLVNAPTISAKVTNMGYAFSECFNLVKAPVIPANVTYMRQAFSSCRNLVNAPDMSKASNVTDMCSAFCDCYSLINAPIIPANVTNMYGTFKGCKSLVNVPDIIADVTDMTSTFQGCSNLETAPILPDTVNCISYAFADCTNLTGHVVITASYNKMVLEDLETCFDNTGMSKELFIPNANYVEFINADKLVIEGVNVQDIINWEQNNWEFTTNDTATLVNTYIGGGTEVYVPNQINDKPVILREGAFVFSEGVTTPIVNVVIGKRVAFENNNAYSAFAGCEELSSVRGFPANVTSMESTFQDCYNLVNIPAIPDSVMNMSDTFWYCTKLVNAPKIPSMVSNMWNTFAHCTNLRGDIIIESSWINDRSMINCFVGTTLPKNVYTYFNCQTYNSAMNIINGKNGVTVYDINTYKG